MPDRSLYIYPIINDTTALSLRLPCWLLRLVKIIGMEKAGDSPGEVSQAQRNAIKARAGILHVPAVTLISAAPACTAASAGQITYLCAGMSVYKMTLIMAALLSKGETGSPPIKQSDGNNYYHD